MQPPHHATEAAHEEQTATQRALRLAEILLKIMVQLIDDHKTLRTAIFVNRAWAEEATNVLWRNVSVSRLALVANPRRQFYAGKIHILDFGGDEDGVHHESFSTLSFPRLKRVNVDSYTPRAGQHLHVEQYIQPSLIIFGFYGDVPADNLLKLLEDRCPRLRKVTLDGPREGLTPERLLLFLQRCRSLLSINFGPHMEEFVVEEILFHLAGRVDLRSMELPGEVLLEDVRKIHGKVSEPFVSLRRLEVKIDSRAAAEILPALKSLRDLSLTVSDDQVNIFTVVSHMTELIRLNVSFGDNATLSKADLQSLGRLVHLQGLSIEPAIEDNSTLDGFDLSNEDFTGLAERLPALENFTFQVQHNLDGEHLIRLGMSCRHLKRIEMPGEVNLGAICAPVGVLFPELMVLELGSVDEHLRRWTTPFSQALLEREIGEVVNEIVGNMPKLQELYFRDGDPLSDQVIAAFKQRTGSKYNS